jgi:hypothetical protein
MAGSPSEVVRVRGTLDAALLALRAVQDPALQLSATEEALAKTLRSLYAAQASAAGSAAVTEALGEALDRAREALGPLQRSGSADPAVLHLGSVLSEVVTALEGTVRLPPSPGLDLPGPGTGPSLVPALRDEPRLLTLRREVLEPAIAAASVERVPPVEVDPEEVPPRPPPSLEALLAEATAAAKAAEAEPEPSPPPRPRVAPPPDPAACERELFGEALNEEQLLFERARHFFEDLGMMGLMRRPLDDAHWRTPANVERRLLAKIDAILACGIGVFPKMVRLLGDSPLPDAELTWAAIMLHGMLAGDDMFDQVVRLVRISDLADPASFDSVADALRLIPHPRTESVLGEWVAGTDVTLRRLGLRALGCRGQLPATEAFRAIQDERVELRLEGARALPRSVGAVDDGQLARLLREEDPLIVEAGIQTSLLRRRPLGARAALQLLREGRGDFARAGVYAAVSTTEEARPAFARAWAGLPTPVLIQSLGWFGDLDAVDPLLTWLAAGHADCVPALQRLTGASLTDEVPDPSYPEPEQLPFGQVWREPPPFPVLTADPEIWQSWWKKHRARVARGVRFRWGRAFSAQALLWEVDQGPFAAADRRLSHLELVIRTGGSLPLDPEEFVARQERQVAAWRKQVAQSEHLLTPGRWAARFAS